MTTGKTASKATKPQKTDDPIPQGTAEALAEKEKTPSDVAEVQETDSAPPATAEAQDDTNALHGIAALAEKNRLPTWQSAALNRLMGWGEGKLVTDDAYTAALKRLHNRPIGG